jgi:hypothetical protein
MTKPNKIKLKKRIMSFLEEHGATPSDGLYSLMMETNLGLLRLSVHDEIENRKLSPWVATRFEDVERAKVRLGNEINPYTGKWNFHFFDGCGLTAEQCAEYFESELQRVL